jgi:hypothetical protein
LVHCSPYRTPPLETVSSNFGDDLGSLSAAFLPLFACPFRLLFHTVALPKSLVELLGIFTSKSWEEIGSTKLVLGDIVIKEGVCPKLGDKFPVRRLAMKMTGG